MLGFSAFLILVARIRLDDDVTIATPEGTTRWSARLLDVSAGGMGAMCDRELSLGSTYDVRSPIDFQGEARTVTARMQVVYCVPQEDLGSYRIGFQLLRPEEDADQIPAASGLRAPEWRHECRTESSPPNPVQYSAAHKSIARRLA
jgi:PilZ domain